MTALRAFLIVGAAVYAISGAVLVNRRASDPNGWICVALGIAWLVAFAWTGRRR